MENNAYLLLGSNLGNRKENLRQAIQLLENSPCTILKTSAIYETSAWGLENQPDFLNQVIEIETPLTVYTLLGITQDTELKLGRERTVKYGARTLDIDILYFNDSIIVGEYVTIPHPELQNRRFTLIPLAEIAPDYVHPELGLTNKELLEKCDDTGLVSLFTDDIL